MPKLLRTLKNFYATHKRGFPWRNTTNPYKILVSEIMLQQTQAGRVIPFYKKFIKEFPTAKVLARAKLSKVLQLWQGLGYNRRAKFLHQAAGILSGAKVLGEGSRAPVHLSRSRGVFAKQLSAEFLASLPGVGPYTARAIATFAFNKPEVFIETNIRTVFLYHCFAKRSKSAKEKGFCGAVSDKEILPLVEEALNKSKMQPRDFYAALMDYGAFLKVSGIKLNSRSKHYTQQSKFEGSARQLRGALLRELLKKPQTFSQLIKKFSPARSRGEVETELGRLAREGMIRRHAKFYQAGL